MTSIQFARLSDTSLRDAWPNEAQDFTPWLYENMDFLSKALGIELEATDMEAAVDSFSADIIARDSLTGERILIENQLESSDHKHLGQILTYLAGIEAKSVIWIAREFQEAHRSAIRWLNEHTDDDFAFFAVRLRLVRIGESPYAPVFEVVEQPNNWERALGQRTDAAESELGNIRKRFWDRYLQMHSGLFDPTRHSNVWIPMLSNGDIVLSMYVASKTSGMFLRGRFGAGDKDLEPFMSRHASTLEKALGTSESPGPGKYYLTSKQIAVHQESRWDELIDWMEKQRKCYVDAFQIILTDQ